MRLLSLCSLAIFATAAVAQQGATDEFEAPQYTRSEVLYSWPLNEAAPKPWAKVSFDPISLKGKFVDYEVKKDAIVPEKDEPVRLGLYDKSTKEWRGVLTTANDLSPTSTLRKTIRLYLDSRSPQAQLWSVALQTSPPSSTLDKSEPAVFLVSTSPEDTRIGATLNKPVPVNPETGKLPEPPAEKSFFQKYWWILVAVIMIATSISAPEEEKK